MADLYSQAANLNLNDLSPDLANKQSAAFNTFYGNQKGDVNSFVTDYSNFVNSQPTTNALYQRISGEIGLPQAQGVANSLNRTLFQLPSTYSAATTGYDVNNNQLSRIIGQKQSELAPSAALATQNVASLEDTANKRLGFEQQDFANKQDVFKTQGSLLNDRLARESTGFGQLEQRELDGLIAKFNAGVQLTEGERNRANALAVAEKNYQATVKAAEIAAPKWG